MVASPSSSVKETLKNHTTIRQGTYRMEKLHNHTQKDNPKYDTGITLVNTIRPYLSVNKEQTKADQQQMP